MESFMDYISDYLKAGNINLKLDNISTKSEPLIIKNGTPASPATAFASNVGRFDRQIVVSAPDVKAREQILEVHSRKKRLSEDLYIVYPPAIPRGTIDI